MKEVEKNMNPTSHRANLIKQRAPRQNLDNQAPGLMHQKGRTFKRPVLAESLKYGV